MSCGSAARPGLLNSTRFSFNDRLALYLSPCLKSPCIWNGIACGDDRSPKGQEAQALRHFAPNCRRNESRCSYGRKFDQSGASSDRVPAGVVIADCGRSQLLP